VVRVCIYVITMEELKFDLEVCHHLLETCLCLLSLSSNGGFEILFEGCFRKLML